MTLAARSPDRASRRPRHLAIMIILAVAVAAGLGIAFAIRHESASPAPRPDLQRVLDTLVTGRGRIAPGATAYVIGPKGTWFGSAGVADLRTNQPITPDTRMRLESVSKIYTATLILELAQEGKLRVTDTVSHWLPGLLPCGNRITIRQLLTMTSGLIDNNDLLR